MQVNPGETFTIRAEDGSLQCIQGEWRCYCIIIGALFGIGWFPMTKDYFSASMLINAASEQAIVPCGIQIYI